ncbi:MAG TPA: hypothetical protein PLV68_06370 [Ilumatobacteraceae bacterium]|nr:hypothetical protein [Ilumatobacteraceae bacterium]
MGQPRCLPTLIVCTGKDCRDEKGYRSLLDLARDEHGSLAAPCQGLCDGPVVAVRYGDDVRWYRRARSKSARKLLAKLLHSSHPGTGKAAQGLREFEVRKRHNIIRGSNRLKQLNA